MTDYAKKLAAWLHDPAEKALILLRDAAGHEWGTAKALREQLGIDYTSFDKRADHLAAAADRPQWPRPDDKRFNRFEQVDFTREPELIHPLSGARIDLSPLTADIGVQQIKAVSQDHFERLIQEDARKTFLAFWRFGPEAGCWATELGPLWKVLPADTRVPDHSIWSHVDTVAAIHTALAGDAEGPDQPALLAMSFGPVQGFIAQVRSTSDLWAGSHLLSTLVWEAIRTIAEKLGPDAIVFPALRGVPAVDRWLVETGGASFRALFEEIRAEFLDDASDTNPLFAASLPNKFLAVVPARQARRLAEAAVAAIQAKAHELAEWAAQKVFDAAGVVMTDVTRQQISEQLAGFPEAYWAAASWPIDGDTRDVSSAAERLRTALDTIHPALKGQGIFDARVWPVLTKELKLADFTFWSPNTGVLYPAAYELAERSLAAAKATRPFGAITQSGHRCTLTGEAEWLTDEKGKLGWNRTDRGNRGTVWTKLAKERPSWVKEGEHLCAIATLKRLWPTMFAEELKDVVGEKVNRYVVSTHAMALSTSIERLLDGYDATTLEKLSKLSRDHNIAQDEPVTLPKALHVRIRKETNANAEFVLKRLPSALERLRDAEDRSPMDKALKQLFGEDNKPETYYALIQMDGDRMGGWLAGNENDYKLAYRETWHRRVANHVNQIAHDFPELTGYLNAKRPSSPGRHAAISQALNDFSTHLARHMVEDCCKGKLLYAGGDDVLALVAVDDLFDAMQLLRLAYSGIEPDDGMGLTDRLARFTPSGARGAGRLLLAEGFGFLRGRNGSPGRLMTLMGHKATASLGAVVAHHTAPLGMVLRQLREAEGRAKGEGRDRFCLRVLKRGGGEVSVTSPWWPVSQDDKKLPQTGRSALALMKKVSDHLAGTDFSRGAIYRAQLWLEGLPESPTPATPYWRDQMAETLAAQFERQGGYRELAREVVDFVVEVIRPEKPKTTIEHFLVTSEFFAREARSIQLGGRRRRDGQKNVEVTQ
jgi:CRISPR-associated protein Cmr2